MKLLIAAAAAAFALPALAGTTTFDFTPQGAVAEGFTPVGETDVTFYGNVPGNLSVLAVGESNGSPALLALDDTNQNYIIGYMNVAANKVSLDFGNDDPFFTNPGDLAVLIGYDTFLNFAGYSTVVLNRDDLMNQSISFYNAAGLGAFIFAYTNSNFVPSTGGGDVAIGLIEVIDNVTVSVPEPASWGMMIAGFGLVGGAMRRRQSLATA